MGSHGDIQAAKLEDVRNFFKLYYAPNNASLAIVGDFDPANAKKLVEKYFGPLKRGAPVPKIVAVTPSTTPGALRGAQSRETRWPIFPRTFWAAASPAGFTKSWCTRNKSRWTSA